MGRAKEIIVKVIPANIANPFVKSHHYSGKVVQNSNLHFGAFLDGKLHGVMSFGPSMDKSKLISLVEGTKWNEFIELNRMAFDDYLPRNAESYCIGKALRLIKKNAPHIKWVVSFADGCQCGDGTIYRASNFVLTAIKKILPSKRTLKGKQPQTFRFQPTDRKIWLFFAKSSSLWRAICCGTFILSTRNAAPVCPFPKSPSRILTN